MMTPLNPSFCVSKSGTAFTATLVLIATTLVTAGCTIDGGYSQDTEPSTQPTSPTQPASPTPPPSQPAITLSPSRVRVTAHSPTREVFTASGGSGTYTYSVSSGPGTINSSGEFYSTSSGASVVTATDSAGQSATSNVTNLQFRTNGEVSSIAEDSTHWYIGGTFTAVNPIEAPGFIVLDPTGNRLPECNLGDGFNGRIESIVITPSAIYAGGWFTTYQGLSANNLAKINRADCSLDTTFSPPAANGFDSTVEALAVSGSSLYVGGYFTAYKGVAESANRLAKLDLTTGAIDTTFSPVGATTNGFDQSVSALAVSGSSLYVGGSFSTYKGVANSARRLAKLDLISGTIDTTFSPPGASTNGFESAVYDLVVSGSSLYVGGGFTAYKGVANSANRLAKLDLTTGAIDTTFSPAGASSNGFNNFVYALAVTSSSLYVGGDFTAYKGVADSANRLAKLDLTTGEIDTTFSPVGITTNGFNGSVLALASSDNSLYVGGGFTNYKGVANSARNIAKLDLTTGAIDTAFGPAGATRNGFKNTVYALVVSDSSLYVGGSFVSYGGLSANRVAKISKSTGALDTVFSPAAGNGFNNSVTALTASGGSLYVGGSFTAYKDVADSANRLAKLDLTTGAIDTTFSPVGATSNGFDNGVNALAVSGGSLYAGGNFTAYKGVANSANRLAKLDLTTGAIDTTFSPAGASTNGFNQGVNVLAVSGSSLYVGGYFTAYKGVPNSANRLAKLDLTTGAIDTTFSPASANGFDQGVTALAISGSSLYVGGWFNAYKGVASAANYLAKLDLTSGAIDTIFCPAGATSNGFNNGVYAFAVAGSSLYVGGNFTAYKGVANSANRLAKLDLTSGAIDTTFSPAGASTNGFDGNVNALVVSGTSLFIGGFFTQYRGSKAPYLLPINLTSGASLD